MPKESVPMNDLITLSLAVEAILFAAGEPMTVSDLRRVLRRADCDLSALSHEGAPGDADAAEGLEEPGGDSNPLASQTADAAAVPQGTADAADAGNDRQEVLLADFDPDAPTEGRLSQDDFSLKPDEAHRPKTLSHAIRGAIKIIERRWHNHQQMCGFAFMEVAGGYTFRTQAAYRNVVAALKEERPARLSRPAMESLAIVAYRQPCTKPEIDALRGVDSGGTMKVLLDRKLVAVVGKKEEPGRPLLYGTTDAFLSLFNLPSLSNLPSLREFNELNVDSEDALRAFDGLPTLAELSMGQKQFRMDEAPSIDALDAAVDRLKDTEGLTRSMLLEHGVTLAGDESDGPTQAAPVARDEGRSESAPHQGAGTLH